MGNEVTLEELMAELNASAIRVGKEPFTPSETPKRDKARAFRSGKGKRFLFTSYKREHVIQLANVLANPLLVARENGVVNGRAERMWRVFGRDTDINIELNGDYVDVYGPPDQVEMFSDLCLGLPKRPASTW